MALKDSYQASYIRQKAVKGEIDVCGHAMKQMGIRKIRLDDVYKAIAEGKELEIQKFPGKNTRVLYQEASENIPSFAVAVAIDHPDIQVITAFRFDEKDKWEYIEDQNIWRRIK